MFFLVLINKDKSVNLLLLLSQTNLSKQRRINLVKLPTAVALFVIPLKVAII